MTKYYSERRPLLPGGYPAKDKALQIVNFDERIYCEEIAAEAWGYIEYSEPLSAEQADAYELTLAGQKKFWGVTTTVYDNGRVTSAITSVITAVRIPENKEKELARKTIYMDWFSSEEEANAFVEDTKNA